MLHILQLYRPLYPWLSMHPLSSSALSLSWFITAVGINRDIQIGFYGLEGTVRVVILIRCKILNITTRISPQERCLIRLTSASLPKCLESFSMTRLYGRCWVSFLSNECQWMNNCNSEVCVPPGLHIQWMPCIQRRIQDIGRMSSFT